MKVKDHCVARLFLLAALLSCASLSPLAAQLAARQSAKTVDIGELGRQVRVLLDVGDTLRVVLPSNPSTGYSWQIAKNNGAFLQASAARTLPATEPKPGAPGTQSFTFTAAAPGKDRLLLNYRRPWEKNVRPARSYAVDITIDRSAATHSDAPVVTPAGTLLATYGGRLPCADCSGIRTSIAFYASGPRQFTGTYYVRTMTYLGAPNGDVTTVNAGTWSLRKGTPADPNAAVYSLRSNQSAHMENYQSQGDTLIPLGSDGKPIQSAFSMNLHKQR